MARPSRHYRPWGGNFKGDPNAKAEKGQLSQRAREEAHAISSMVKAWEIAQERVRINRGKPLPGTLRPKEKKPKYQSYEATIIDPSAALGE